jgi:hypothetical protein
VFVDDWNEAAMPQMERWLKREKPDVIITPAADPVLAPLTRAGWRVPADLGLALLACPRPGDAASGIYQNGRLIGALAVDALIDLVERHEFGLPAQSTTLMVEGCWKRRAHAAAGRGGGGGPVTPAPRGAGRRGRYQQRA